MTKESSSNTMPPSPPLFKKTRVGRKQPIDVEETTFIHFPSNFLEFDGVGNGIWLAADKLLFPVLIRAQSTFYRYSLMTRHCLTRSYMGPNNVSSQGLQSVMAAKSMVEGANTEELKKKLEDKDKTLARLKEERTLWEAKFKTLEEVRLKEAADHVAEVEELKEKMEEIEAGNESLKKEKEELLNDYAAADLTGQAKMAYKVYFGYADKEICKEAINWYVVNLGSMRDLEEKEDNSNKEASASTADSPATIEPKVGDEAGGGGNGAAET